VRISVIKKSDKSTGEPEQKEEDNRTNAGGLQSLLQNYGSDED